MRATASSTVGRRRFLQSGVLAGAVGSVTASGAAGSTASGGAGPAAPVPPNVRPFELEEATITDL